MKRKMSVTEMVNNLNEQLDTLYDALEDKNMTKHEKRAIMEAIEEIEAEITDLIGCWDEETSLYFNNGKNV